MIDLRLLLLALIPLLFSLSFHEASHAWVANRLGDPTAKMMGRITLNPAPHIDILGTIILPAVFYLFGGMIFGWAKPVPVNDRNLRNPVRDNALVAAAGPVSNILLALGFTFVLFVLARLGAADKPEINLSLASVAILEPLTLMAQFGIQLNILLALFNLIPLPPLDGSKVAEGLFPEFGTRLAFLHRYSFFIFLALLFTGVFHYIIFYPTMIISRFLVGLAV